METLPLRLCGLGRCHLHGNAGLCRPGCADGAWMLRIGGVLSCGVTRDERRRCCGWREPGEEGTGMALRTPARGGPEELCRERERCGTP